MSRPQKIMLFAGVCMVILAAVLFIFRSRAHAPAQRSATEQSQPPDRPTPQQPAGFNKQLHPLDEPGSPWWVVNKKRPLPAGYVPPDLVVPDVRLRLDRSAEQMHFSNQATPALKEMFAAAAQEGVNLVFGSGYRSEAYQRTLYNGYVASVGQTEADRVSARPGTSEHQTGLAFDATSASGQCHLEACFADLPEGKWLAAHAYEYGFVLRYPNGKESITGYTYEPWHMRFVGKELATEMHRTGFQTLEEFFGLPAAPTY
jgi:D-alanyl-D-alanine carboxypeptidase